MEISYLKALHIIFVVCWFAALFYIVRLFIYAKEAQLKGDVARRTQAVEHISLVVELIHDLWDRAHAGQLRVRHDGSGRTRVELRVHVGRQELDEALVQRDAKHAESALSPAPLRDVRAGGEAVGISDLAVQGRKHRRQRPTACPAHRRRRPQDAHRFQLGACTQVERRQQPCRAEGHADFGGSHGS